MDFEKVFGDLIGASQGQEFDQWLKQNATVEYVADRRLNIAKLEAGRIDCFVTGQYCGLFFIKKSGYEGKIVPLENDSPQVFATKIDSLFSHQINKGVSTLISACRVIISYL